MTRPRLLFLCQTLPFPPDGGVNIRTFNILRQLARVYDIDALCFYRRSDRQTPAAVAAGIAGLAPYARVEAFAIPQEYSRPRYYWDHLRSVARGRPYTAYAYDAAPFRARLRALVCGGGYALAHVDSLDLVTYLPELRDLPVACTHHNIESQLLGRRAGMAGASLAAPYLRWQSKLTAAAEARWAPAVALNVVVSPADEVELRRVAPAAPALIIPNGVDLEYFTPGSGPQRGLVFVGGSNWFPNRDALGYFAREILPLVRARSGDLPVTWVGHASPEDRAEFGTRFGVTLTGYVDDVRPYVHAAACYVVPLRVGGGTRLKVLDAWAMGKAVVTTSQGCEGLAAEHGVNALIADTPQGFADAIATVLADPERAAALGRAGRELVKLSYGWDALGRRLIAAYQALSPRAAPSGESEPASSHH
jgi:glycosyltransferase involved in cell wall biosynthesis